MPRTVNQKMKLLYLIRILSEKTDEEHALSTRELISQLEIGRASCRERV